MKALGQDTLLERCQKLNKEEIYGLFFMLLGAMTETDSWSTFYMVLNEILPTWEGKAENRPFNIGVWIDQDT